MFKQLKGFKGVDEYNDEPSAEFAVEIKNLDPDQVLGRLSLRKGFSKKYTTGFPLTNIHSAFEFTIETTGDVILLFYDIDAVTPAFKYLTNGATLTALTLPTGSTVATDFTHNYFGYKDAIRVTTGTGATNHVLWFGYTKKLVSENNGLFANALNDAGTYRFMRQQLIPVNGVLNTTDIHSIVYLGGYYWVAYRDSKFLHKLNTSYQLIERLEVASGLADKSQTTICADTVNTKLYVSVAGEVYLINPAGFIVESNTTGVTITGTINGVTTDGTTVWISTSTNLYRMSLDLSSIAATLAVGGGFITTGSGVLFRVETPDVVDRGKTGAMGINTTTSGGAETVSVANDDAWLYYETATDELYILGQGGSGDEIYHMDAEDISAAKNSTASNTSLPMVVWLDGNSAIRVSGEYGLVEEETSANTELPALFSLVKIDDSVAPISGSLAVGTYFYRYSIIDVEGQEYVLSDPLICRHASISAIRFYITADQNDLVHYYRMSGINIYRAYSSDTDAKIPVTKYKFVNTISINDPEWTAQSTDEIYLYLYTDTVSEGSISDVTYNENTGISENTLPRFVNGKYLTWFNGRLEMANIYTDGDLYKSRVVRSPVDAPDNLAFFDVYKYQEDEGVPIKGITNTYGRTVVFKSNRVGIFYETTKEQEFFPGTSSDKGYHKQNNDIFYSHESGIFVLSGNTHTRINDPVVTSYAAVSDYTDGSIFYFDDKDRLIVSFEDENSFVFNLKRGLSTVYDNHSFKGYLKNSSNEYIGWKDTYFYKLFDTAADDGTAISITYESPRIYLQEGSDAEFTEIQRRLAIVDAGTNPTIKIYKYTSTDVDADALTPGRELVKTITLSDLNHTYPVNFSEFFTGVWGESFSIVISGQVSKFELVQLLLKFNLMGESADV